MKKGGSKTGAGKTGAGKTGTGKPKAGRPKAGRPKAGKPKAAASRGKAGNTPARRDENAALRKELQSLLSDIDEAGLRFLIDQARILRYNEEVDRMNRELQEKHIKLRTELRAEKPSSSPEKTVAPSGQAVTIEEGANRNHFIITLGNSRKFFVRDEFRGLVKVCEAAENAAVASERLFVWLKRNRGDVLADVGIGSGRNPLLIELYRTISRSYRAKT